MHTLAGGMREGMPLFFFRKVEINDDTWHTMKGRQVGYPWQQHLSEAQVVIIYYIYLLK